MSGTEVKVSILGATFNTPNMGVSMLAAGAIRCVLAQFPNAEIVLLDYAHHPSKFNVPFQGRTIPVRFVNLRFSKKLYLSNNIALLICFSLLAKLIPSRRLREGLLAQNQYMRELLECDVVFSVAGGDSFSDIYGLGRFFYVSLPQLLALFAGKRLIFLPQTIGPFRMGLVRAIARFIMNRAEVIYVRERKGLQATRTLLGRSDSDPRLRFCYDMAFDVEPTPPTRLGIVGLDLEDKTAPLVGVNISGLLWAGGYTQNNMFALKVEYRELVHRLIQMLIEEKHARVLLIPHVFGAADSLESDTGACLAVFDELRSKYEGRLGVASGEYNHSEIKYVIGLCSFFTGARMHACIGAISQSIPTVLAAYSDKFAGVMQSIGLEQLVVDPRRMDAEEILTVVGEVFEGRAAVHSRLAEQMPGVKQEIRNALSGVTPERRVA